MAFFRLRNCTFRNSRISGPVWGQGVVSHVINGRVLYRAGAETTTTPNFRERLRLSPGTILKNSQPWIPKPQFWYSPLRFGSQHQIPKHLCFLVFWGVYTADFGFSAWGRILPVVPVTEIRVSAPAPYIKTLPSLDLRFRAPARPENTQKLLKINLNGHPPRFLDKRNQKYKF